MRTAAHVSRLIPCLIAVALLAASCGGSTTPDPAPNPNSNSGSSGGGGSTSSSTSVSIVRGASTLMATAFSPNPLTVPVGTTVTWTNNDTTTHDATADNKSFATGLIAPGASASVTLRTAGRITYFCTIHPGMSGTIDVQ
jgi:plastocyanin